MNVLDFFFLITIAISLIMGIAKGFLRELIGLLFLGIAVYASINYHPEFAQLAFGGIDDKDVSSFLAFLTIFFGILIIGSILGYVLKKTIVFGPLKSLDRLLGALFGIVRGIAVSACVLLGLLIFPVNDKWVSTSKLAAHVNKPMTWIISLLPDDLSRTISKRV